MPPLARLTIFGLASALTFAAGAAQAQCILKSAQIPSEGVFVRYDPFDREGDRTEVPLRLTTSGCENARLDFVVVPQIDSLSPSGGLQATNGGHVLPLGMTLDGASARIAPSSVNAFDATARPARLTGSSGQIEGEGVQITLPYGIAVPPGRYLARAELVARVLNDDGALGAALATPFFVEVDVQPSFRLAAGVERSSLWLGELEDGKQSDPMTFLAYSNTNYALKVISERRGRMTLDGSDAEDAPSVFYDLAISDQDLRWVDGIGRLNYDQPAALSRTHSVVATSRKVDPQRPAGDYKDWVTIQISPQIP